MSSNPNGTNSTRQSWVLRAFGSRHRAGLLLACLLCLVGPGVLRLGLDLENKRADKAIEGLSVSEYHVQGIRITEVVVGDAAPDARLPMVIRFHGRGSVPNVPRSVGDVPVAYRLILPWAPDRLGNGRTWFPLSVTADRDRKVLGHHVEARVDQMAAVVRELTEDRPTLGRPIVTGFSQGGMLTLGFARLEPELVSAALPIAGWLHPDAEPPEPARLPIIRAIHGAGDPIVPLDETRDAIRTFSRWGYDATLEVFESDEHAITPAIRRRYEQHLRYLLEQVQSGPSSLG